VAEADARQRVLRARGEMALTVERKASVTLRWMVSRANSVMI
jgi:hypothetical protein